MFSVCEHYFYLRFIRNHVCSLCIQTLNVLPSLNNDTQSEPFEEFCGDLVWGDTVGIKCLLSISYICVFHVTWTNLHLFEGLRLYLALWHVYGVCGEDPVFCGRMIFDVLFHLGCCFSVRFPRIPEPCTVLQTVFPISPCPHVPML